jgi:outer membrane protein
VFTRTMRNRIIRDGAAVLLLSAAAARAQTPPSPGTLTLDDAIAKGLAYSARLAELGAREKAAEATVAASIAADRPIAAALGGYTRTNHVDVFAVPTTIGRPPQVIYPDVPDNYRARLDLQWPIYTGGRSDALERAAVAERHASGDDLTAARADLRLEITRAYWALATARETAMVLARSLDAIDAQVGDLQVRLDQGLIPPNDLLSAQAQQSRQRGFAIEARNARASAEADLRRLTGIEDPGEIVPAAPLTERGTVPLFGERGTVPLSPLIAQALAARPERQALAARVTAADARRDAAHAAGRPFVSLAGGYDYARPNPRIFPRSAEWNPSWDAAVNVAWSLWDGGRRAADEALAAANAAAARARLDEFDRQVTLEVRQRSYELDSSRAAVAATDDERAAAAEAERVVGERYRAGVATATDVLDAQVARLQADLDRTRALANVKLAEARLARALGQQP